MGNWKSTLIIAISIPLSILVSILCLSALGETINIMTLGGLALAVGILVDDATVEIENINRNLAMGKETVQAILDGAQQIAVPAFVSTLCICIVFIPMFFLSGVAKYPVRAAGGSGDLRHAGVVHVVANDRADDGDVPVERGRRISRRPARRRKDGFVPALPAGVSSMPLSDSADGYRRALATALDRSRMLLCACFPVLLRAFRRTRFLSGSRFFPQRGRRTDSSALCARAPACASKKPHGWPIRSIRVIRHTIPEKELVTVLDNIGLPYSGINLTYSNSGTIGTSDGEILVQLKQERGKSDQRVHQRSAQAAAAANFPACNFSFSPRTSLRRF